MRVLEDNVLPLHPNDKGNILELHPCGSPAKEEAASGQVDIFTPPRREPCKGGRGGGRGGIHGRTRAAACRNARAEVFEPAPDCSELRGKLQPSSKRIQTSIELLQAERLM